MTRTTFWLASAAAAVLAVSAGANAGEIKVGSAGGITGPIAELVVPILAGRDLAAKQVNEQGGLLKGDTMTMVVGDGQCDPKAAVDMGNKLVNVEQVVAIVGPSCSGETNGLVQSVTIPAGVVNISDSATAPSISALKDNDVVFRVAASDAYQGVALAGLALKTGYKKIAVTYSNDDYNSGLAAEFAKAFTAQGGTVTANLKHEPKQASYRAEVTTLAEGKPDALAVFAYYGSSGITILKNAIEAGAFSKFMGADGMFAKEVLEQVGADALKGNIQITQAASDPDSASYKAFADAYKAGTKFDPAAPFAAHGYDATFLMAMAIEKAGSADRSKIAAALREVANAPGEPIMPGEWAKAKKLIDEGKDVDYVGATGPIEFDANGDVTGIYSVNTVDADGKYKLVEYLR